MPNLSTAAAAAARAIPPAWPLMSSVAVNPYLGQANQTLAETAALLARVAGAPVMMPRAWYHARVASGAVTESDLAAALTAAQPPADLVISFAQLAGTSAPQAAPRALPTVADLCAEVSGIDWPGIISERIGSWAASYFDGGQALWAAPKGKSAYTAWRSVATYDLTPEILGLRSFAGFIADAPETAEAALRAATTRLGVSTEAAPTYLHSLLVTLGGWAQYARYCLWQAELGGDDDSTLTDFLAIRLMWEDALLTQYRHQIGSAWVETMAAHARPVKPSETQIVDAILQEACERAGQRELAKALSAALPKPSDTTPRMQAAFCIDVRSEVFRRALESVDPAITTIGFAGFFGIAPAHRRFASDVAEHRLPVLLNPALSTRAGDATDAKRDAATRYAARGARAWGRFKLAAVSSFAFVEATGPAYAVKLLRDALGLHGAAPAADPAPRPESPLDLPSRVSAALSVLHAMSLTDDFAPLVLLLGHGATVANNPHASALQCGACGGYSGDVNARLLAALLNDPDVRTGLGRAGIAIPPTTLFVGGLHDTTTDAVTLYANDHPAVAHCGPLAEARAWLAAAGALTRAERALRLPRAPVSGALQSRSRNWAETRPEWALAGCQSFIAAPRGRTIGKNLSGRAFLHDYDWRNDNEFGVLELIMTAPVVVASWISLQYYGSSVSPELFGGGNKLLHNVVGGIGVVEGNGGLLRSGLPWQSVHDGSKLVHDPVRLTVCVEAPRAAMSEILTRHPNVRALFDNRWLHLIALDDRGHMAWRYCGDLVWEAMADEGRPADNLELVY